MSELATLARPYASAVFKRAKETGKASEWSEMLAFMMTVLTSDEIASVIANPKVKKDNLVALLVDIFSNNIDNEGINFIKLLLHNGRLSLIANIKNVYEELKAEDEGYVAAEVITAFPFTKEAEKKFANTLGKALNKKIQMTVTVDKKLIGGVLVRAGDKVIDGSVRGQLQHLQKVLQ